MIAFHRDHAADVTIASIRVPIEEASRFGILEVGDNYRITNFIEKPPHPQSNLVNMGVYLFNTDILNTILWEDAQRVESSHDFGKDILPKLVAEGFRVFAYPFTGYWVDVGTVHSYWQSHMDIVTKPKIIGLTDRSWIIHTRTEERPPVWVANNAIINNSMISDGCIIESGAIIEKSVLGPGVVVKPNARITESIIFTDTVIHSDAAIERTIIDKRVTVREKAIIGKKQPDFELVMIGKNSLVPAGFIVEPGSVIATDVTEADYPGNIINQDQYIQTKRMPYEI
jgi:glucose-1-phosphate adenylyltransferase